MDIQEQDEQIKRYFVEQNGERAEISHRLGDTTVSLSYSGFHGTAQVALPVETIEIAIGLLETMKVWLTPGSAPEGEEPEPEPVIPEEDHEPESTEEEPVVDPETSHEEPEPTEEVEPEPELEPTPNDEEEPDDGPA